MAVVVAALKTLPRNPQSQSQVSTCPKVSSRIGQGWGLLVLRAPSHANMEVAMGRVEGRQGERW